MRKTITQRELRNGSGKIMRALDGGQSFLVTRNGVPVGELRPLPRRQFVPAADVVSAFTSAPPLDGARFRRDLDALLDQDPRPVARPSAERGLLDTSVLIDLERIDPASLPSEVAISALTLAELAAGPHATTNPAERARRQERLQRVEATFAPLAFDVKAARAFGRLYAAVAAKGRKTRGRRAIDLLIAATAISEGLPLYTRSPDDFRGLGDLLDVRTIDLAAHSTSG